MGSYDPVTLGENDRTKLYLGSGNTLYYPNAALTIGPCRAHFVLKGITAGEKVTEVRAFSLNFGENEPTGIIPMSQDESMEGAASGWFTLDGRRLGDKPTQHGVYLNGGKKFVVN